MATITAQAPLPVTPTHERQINTVESTEAAEATTPKVDEALSPKFAALARKERALRAQAQQLKAQADALKMKESEYQTSYISKADLQKRLADDPMSFINEHGLSWDQITQAALNQSPQDTQIKALKAEIEALRNDQNTVKTTMNDQQTKAYEQAVNQIRNDAKMLVHSDSKFETIKETRSEEAIVTLIEETFKADGTLLSVDEAAEQVENYLIEEGMKMARLNKVKAKLMPQEAEKPAPHEKQQLKTLTNATTASTPTRLTQKDRIERAKLAFMGQLK